jgi:preprotein translocase subunit SecA
VVKLADRSLEIEHGYLQRAIETTSERATEALETQTSERQDLLDTFFSGLRDAEEKPKPQQALEELQSLVRLPIKLDNNQLRALASDPDSVKEEIRDMVSDQLTDLSVSRLVGAVENRLGESLGISKEKLAEMPWEELTAAVAEHSTAVLARQRERLAGPNGQIARDADMLLQRESLADDSSKLRLLLNLAQGARNVFDARTHRQVKQVYTRLNYSFRATELLQDKAAEDVIEEILDHLENAEDMLTLAWGREELARRGASQDEQMDEEKASDLGFRLLNEAHRRLLLGAITELWVDYLTRVEALRISISLEAYAQRDPLVQYKSRASEMFQGLLEDIRGLVVGRLFAIQRRPSLETLEETAVQADEATPEAQVQPAAKKKRKRH